MKLAIKLLALFFLPIASSVHAAEVCEASAGLKTISGVLKVTDCTSNGVPIRSFLLLNEQKIVEDKALLADSSSVDRSLRIYTSGTFPVETGCAAKLYLVDLSRHPVKVIAFGVKSACNEFHWASWGKKRSVIALKHNVQFVYEDGKLTPPKQGEKLASMIEPPHSSRGGGMDEETAIPFAEDVPFPK